MMPGVRPQLAGTREFREPSAGDYFNNVTRSKLSFRYFNTGNAIEEPARRLSPSTWTPPLPATRYQNGARSGKRSVGILNELLSTIILPLRFLVVDDFAFFAAVIGKMLGHL